MSRRNVTSLNYSQVPCDILRTRAVMLVVKAARKTGVDEDFITKLLLAIPYFQIYIHGSEKGYYAVHDRSFVEGFALETNLDIDEVERAFSLAADAGVVDGQLYKQGIITSWTIQNAYFEAIARIRRRRPKETPYLLVDLDNYPFAKTESSEESSLTSEEKGKTTEDKAVSSEVMPPYSKSKVMYIYPEEREKLALIFHSERGLLAWEGVVDDFVSRLTAVGWKDGVGRQIEDIVLYARNWTVRDSFIQQGFIYRDDESKDAYAELYHTLKDVPDSHLLTNVKYVRKRTNTLVIRTDSDELKQFILSNKELIEKSITKFTSIAYEKEESY